MREESNKKHRFIFKAILIVLGLLLAYGLGYLTAYRKLHDPHTHTLKALPTGSTQMISGVLTDVLDGRPVDGNCYMIVNDKKIIVEPSGFTTPPIKLDGPFGQLIISGVSSDATCADVAKYKSRNVQIFAQGDDKSTYLSIYGNNKYFINILP